MPYSTYKKKHAQTSRVLKGTGSSENGTNGVVLWSILPVALLLNSVLLTCISVIMEQWTLTGGMNVEA